MGDCCNSLDLIPDQEEKSILQLKVVNLENQLWKCVQSTGLMSAEAQLLYKQVCLCFEKLILCATEFTEIQDVEYSLWKFHYKHIDEFRRRIRQKGTANAGSPLPPRPPNGPSLRQNSNNHIDGFKLFLSEATKFYQDLLLKVRRRYSFLEEKPGIVVQSQATVRNCQFMCHRFLICIGDLARYKELHDSNDARTRKWSVAATYYMKATVIWPDGGNSQNQLALLATYVGDEFLALYHCVRSLAVKEPFPDAWNNLMLLFEKNQSIVLHSISNEVRFDFSNPSARTRTNLQRKIDKNGSGKTELWHLFIRLISFFLTKKWSEDFSCTLGSTLAELEALMELDDTELRGGLESYQQMGTSRTGPFRALQIVSVLIFVFKHQTEALKQTELESVNVTQQLESVQLSLVAAFICIGRLVDRCLKFSPLHSCPLLPGVLVFLEWLAIEIDEVDAHCGDQKVLKASCYFVDSVVKLLNLIKITHANRVNKGSNTTALWEDFELQGFVPLDKAQTNLDFSDQIGNRKNFENGQDCRITRICNSAVSLASRKGLSRQWICYNPSVQTFSVPSPEHSSFSESQLSKDEFTKISHRASDVGDNSDIVDEEEVILFKPIVRHNSEPIRKSVDKESINSVTIDPQQVAMDECIRRSKSLLVSESQLNTNSADIMDRQGQLKIATPNFNPMFSNFIPNNHNRKPDTSKEPSSPRKVPEYNNSSARGPPSLSAWVLEKGSPGTDWPKDLDSICKSHLKPIEVEANKSSSPLSISSTQCSVTGSSQFSPTSPKYSNGAALPLTPRLGTGITGSPQESISDLLTGYLSSPRLIDEVTYPNTTGRPVSPTDPTSPGKHRPLSGMLTSSEWLRQYREKQSLKQQPQTTPMSPPARSQTPPRTNMKSPEDASIELYDRWGNPVVSVPKMNLPIPPPFSGLGGERLWEKVPPMAYGLRNEAEEEEPRPLLQYLKEREMWRMQQKQHSRSRSPPPPAYMKT